MLTRKRKTIDPCPKCFLHRERCICSQIPRLDLKTKVSVVVHAKELKRTTNSGRLAIHALVNSQMLIRGQRGTPLDLSSLILPDYENYVLYPSADAVELETLQPTKPVHLIVADGNWRQAGKLNVRHPEIRHLPRVKIGRINSAEQHLRKEHMPEGLSTLEAIALALGCVEGASASAALQRLYQAKLAATLAGRPRLS
jgi:DTW domain-containing protein YfiP